MACLQVKYWLLEILFGQWPTSSRRNGFLPTLQQSTAMIPASSPIPFVASLSASQHGCLQRTYQRAGTTRLGGSFWMDTWGMTAHLTPVLLWLLKWQCSGCRCMPLRMGTSSQMPRKFYFHQVWRNAWCMINMQKSTKDPAMQCHGQPFSSTGRVPAHISQFQRYSPLQSLQIEIIITFIL